MIDKVLFTLFLSFLCSSSLAASVALTKDTFDKLTEGKTVFIKLYAPWCGHCQEMAPAWEKLAKEWEGHKQGLIAEADCTQDATSERWCQKEMGVGGFPTLLYGDPSYGGIFLEQYTGARTYEDLSAFAKETIAKPFCTPGNLNACDADTRKQIEMYLKMSDSSLDNAIEEKEKLIEAAQKDFEKEFDRMQAIYDKQAQEFEFTSARIKYDLKMIRSVQEARE